MTVASAGCARNRSSRQHLTPFTTIFGLFSAFARSDLARGLIKARVDCHELPTFKDRGGERRFKRFYCTTVSCRTIFDVPKKMFRDVIRFQSQETKPSEAP